MKYKITDGLYVNLKDNEEVLITYKIYDEEVEILEFKKWKKKEANNANNNQ